MASGIPVRWLVPQKPGQGAEVPLSGSRMGAQAFQGLLQNHNVGGHICFQLACSAPV